MKGPTNLRELYLNGTQVTDAGLLRLRAMTNLQELWLSAVLLFVPGAVFFVSLVAFEELFHVPLEGPIIDMLIPCSVFHILIVLLAHLFYWYWSVGSLILMWVFTLIDMVAVIGFLFLTAPRLKHRRT